MANHLTPEELSKELGIDRQEVIRVCIEEGVPIYQGKIDKTLFAAQLQALGAPCPEVALAAGPTPTCARPPSCAAAPPASSRRAAAGSFACFASSTLRRSASIRSTTGASLDGLRRGDLLAGQLGLEQRAEVAAVLALQLVRVELADEARDHLLRELELRLLDGRLLDRLLDLGLRVDVLGEEERLERERLALGADQAELLLAPGRSGPSPPSVSRIASSSSTYGRRAAGAWAGTRKYVRSKKIGSTSEASTKRLISIDRESSCAVERLELLVLDEHELALRDLPALDDLVGPDVALVHRAAPLLLDRRAALAVQHPERDVRRRARRASSPARARRGSRRGRS